MDVRHLCILPPQSIPKNPRHKSRVVACIYPLDQPTMKPSLVDRRADDWNLLEGIPQIIENKSGAILQVEGNP
jgi:hypothetical protein